MSMACVFQKDSFYIVAFLFVNIYIYSFTRLYMVYDPLLLVQWTQCDTLVQFVDAVTVQ
jgi:hypothetical protein